MKRFKFTIHKYKGEDGSKKPYPVAEFEMKVIDDDMAYELAEAMEPFLPWNGFVIQEEIPNDHTVACTCTGIHIPDDASSPD